MDDNVESGRSESELRPADSCGCKGARSCALCAHSERVLKLRLEEDPYRDYTRLVYSAEKQTAFPAGNLNSDASLSDIENAENTGGTEIRLNGLILCLNFISEEEEDRLVETIDQFEWMPSQSGRRKQDYGPRVNFKHRKVKLDRFVGMPDYADFMLERMRTIGLADYQPFELCNLEYEANRNSCIDFHQDDMWIWGNRLISVNLLSGSVMTLVNDVTKQQIFVSMPRRSLLCMADDARYQWKHGVLSRHIERRRIALTMREPSLTFQKHGDLFEQYGREMIRLGNIRIDCGFNRTR